MQNRKSAYSFALPAASHSRHMRISRADHVQLKIIQRFDSSQRSIAAAAPAFSDSAPDIGIYTAWSQAFAVALEIPAPSLPMTTAARSGNSSSPSLAAELSSIEPYTRNPISVSPDIIPGSSPVIHGSLNTLPMEARSVLGDQISAHSGDIAAPSNPSASAVRRIVPTLPGSCTPSRSTSRTAPSGIPPECGFSAMANSPCGAFVSEIYSAISWDITTTSPTLPSAAEVLGVLCHKSGQYPESALRKFAAEMISLNGENALSVPYGFFPEKLPEALYSVVFS